MSDQLDRIRTAARAYRRAEAVAETRRGELVALIVEAALETREQQRAIVEATGFTREHIRRIVKAEKDRRSATDTAA